MLFKDSASVRYQSIKKWLASRWLRAVVKKSMFVSTNVVTLRPSFGLNLTAALNTWWHIVNLNQMVTNQPHLCAITMTLVPKCALQKHLPISRPEKTREVSIKVCFGLTHNGLLCTAAASKGHLCLAGTLVILFFSRLLQGFSLFIVDLSVSLPMNCITTTDSITYCAQAGVLPQPLK